jgi:hypothetical protein
VATTLPLSSTGAFRSTRMSTVLSGAIASTVSKGTMAGGRLTR